MTKHFPNPPQIKRPQSSLHRRRRKGTRPGRLGRVAGTGETKRDVRRRAADDQQPMELTAVIEALASLKRTCDVILYTDSEVRPQASPSDPRLETRAEERPTRSR